MDRSIRLGFIIGSIVTLPLIVVVYIFKPLPSPPSQTAKPREKPTTIVTTVEKKAASPAPAQANPVSVPNQAALLQQRDRLYKDFAGISDALSHGEQPDLRRVSQMLEQQQELVKTGTVAAEEAISYCQFLRQILPAMERQIDQNIIELEKLKRSAI